MSRIICPYSDEQIVCIVESSGETDINCDKCWIKKDSELEAKKNA